MAPNAPSGATHMMRQTLRITFGTCNEGQEAEMRIGFDFDRLGLVPEKTNQLPIRTHCYATAPVGVQRQRVQSFNECRSLRMRFCALRDVGVYRIYDPF